MPDIKYHLTQREYMLKFNRCPVCLLGIAPRDIEHKDYTCPVCGCSTVYNDLKDRK